VRHREDFPVDEPILQVDEAEDVADHDEQHAAACKRVAAVVRQPQLAWLVE
jgi:hypothetical protein